MATLTFEEIRDQIQSDLLSEVSTELDLSETSAIGAMVDVFSRQLRKAYEALEEYKAAGSIDARGSALDALCAITLVQRKAATASRATIVCTASAPIGIGEVRLKKFGAPSIVFSNAEIVPIGAGPIVFECETLGPVSAEAGTLSKLVTPVTNLTSFVPNANDAALGAAAEGDGALALRRRASLSAGQSSRIEAIRKAILDLQGVESVTVAENDTLTTSATGVPPKSIHVVVQGPSVPTGADDLAVAQVIAATKPAGISVHGTYYSSVVNGVTARFDRPTIVNATLALTLTVDRATFAGATALKEFLATRSTSFAPGVDVRPSLIVGWIHEFPGVIAVDDLSLDGENFLTTMPISASQTARLTVGGTTVTVVYGAY